MPNAGTDKAEEVRPAGVMWSCDLVCTLNNFPSLIVVMLVTDISSTWACRSPKEARWQLSPRQGAHLLWSPPLTFHGWCAVSRNASLACYGGHHRPFFSHLFIFFHNRRGWGWLDFPLSKILIVHLAELRSLVLWGVNPLWCLPPFGDQQRPFSIGLNMVFTPIDT